MGDLNATPESVEVAGLLAKVDVADTLAGRPDVTWEPAVNPHIIAQLEAAGAGVPAGAGTPEHGLGAAGQPQPGVAA